MNQSRDFTILLILMTFVYSALETFHLGQIRKNFIPSVTTVPINPVWRSLNVYALCLCLIYLYCAVCSLVSTYNIFFCTFSVKPMLCVCYTCVYVPVLCALLFNIKIPVCYFCVHILFSTILHVLLCSVLLVSSPVCAQPCSCLFTQECVHSSVN